MSKITKRIKAIQEFIKTDKQYGLDEALSEIKKYANSPHKAKFNESVDVVLKLGVDPKKGRTSCQRVRLHA